MEITLKKQIAWDDFVARAEEILAAAKKRLESGEAMEFVDLGNLHRQLDDVVDEWHTAIDADTTLFGRYRKACYNSLLDEIKRYRLAAKQRHVALEGQLLSPA